MNGITFSQLPLQLWLLVRQEHMTMVPVMMEQVVNLLSLLMRNTNMKLYLSIWLSIILALGPVMPVQADMTQQTNSITVTIGDSFWYAPDQDPITGCRAIEYTD